MTLQVTHLFLQQYWWVIISILASFLVFLMFVQGGQSLIFSLPGNESERTMLVNAMGRKWEFTFTTLVTFGGAFFASFPLFYATSFGGAYWVWTVILFIFIIQAVSYEYRSKAGNIFGKRTFDTFLLINGSLGPFLIGTAVGTFFTGSAFTLGDMNQVLWQSPWRGLEALASIRNISLGFALLFLSRVNGLLFLVNTVDSDSLAHKSVRKLIINSAFFLVFFLYFLVKTLLSPAYGYDQSGIVAAERFKYFHNFLNMPLVLVLFILGVAAVLYGIGTTIIKGSRKGIWFSGPGTFLAVFALFLVAGLGKTSFYPSVYDVQSSLTIENASSSFFTLNVMMYVSFAVPFILAYIWYAWNALTSKKISEAEMNTAGHKY